MAADVVDLIMQDHREVERLFDELKDYPEKREGLVPVLTTLLSAHSRAEEAEVYPVAAAEADEADEVAHSQEEHVEADQLLAKLAATDPTSAQFEKVLQNLIDAVSHHVEEEETKVLPGMRANLSEERRRSWAKRSRPAARNTSATSPTTSPAKNCCSRPATPKSPAPPPSARRN